MAGYIKLFRKFAEWEWYQDANVVRVFLHLLLTANYEDKRWQGKTVGKGQIIVGRKRLAEALNLTERNIRTALDKLESTGEIKREVTNKYTLITICNYVSYQSTEESERPTNDQQTTNKRPTNDQQTTTTKEYKEINNNNTSTTTHARTHTYTREGDDFERMKEEDGLIESVMMLNHIGKNEVLQKIDEFKAHCQAGMNEHASQGDIRRHFRDWVRIRISEEKKQQQYGNKNKQNNPRGEFEPTPGADYSAPI